MERINDAIARWEEKIARISAGKEEVKERYDAGVVRMTFMLVFVAGSDNRLFPFVQD